MQTYLTNTSELRSIADAIRSKAKTSASLSFPYGFVDALSNLSSEPLLQYVEVTPLEEAQTFTPFGSYDAIGSVFVHAISSTYVGTAIPQKSLSDITISGPTMTVPYGHYSSSGMAFFPSVTGYVQPSTFTFVPTTRQQGSIITVDFRYAGTKTLQLNTPGFINSVSSVNIVASYSSTWQLPVQSTSTFIPSETSYLAISSAAYTTGNLTLAAVSSNYLGSAVSMLSAHTYTPSTEDQYISSGYFLSGAQIILGDSNLVASNIKKNVSIFGVNGTYTGIIDTTQEREDALVSNFSYTIGTSYENSRIDRVGLNIFYNCPITTISIPNCSYIDRYAFASCSLYSISVPLCKTISNYAFSYCRSLSAIYAPLCDTIGIGAFYAANLRSASFSLCSQIQNSTFQNCTSLSIVSFPLCESIAPSAFTNCTSLSQIFFPICSYLREYAFANAGKVGCSFEFPSCTTISGSCFSGVRASFVSLPVCTGIPTSAFYWSPCIVSVYAPLCEYISKYAFYSCSKIEIASFPACLSIGSYAFAWTPSLKSISFPSVTSLDNYAFYHCPELESANFPNVSYIPFQCFFSNFKLSSISFPACTYISGSAFAGCSSLTYIEFPSCTIVAGSAFGRCIGLQSASFPVCSCFYDYCFYGCSSLANFYAPVFSKMGSHCFDNTGFVSVNFSSLQRVEPWAFQSCSLLENVYLPECTVVSTGAFKDCVMLKSVVLPKCTNIGAAFINNPNLEYLEAPEVVEIRGNCFTGASKISVISLPKCRSLNGEMFSGCNNLLSLYLLTSDYFYITQYLFANSPFVSSVNGIYPSIYMLSMQSSRYTTSSWFSSISSRIVWI